jgi:hypothetical protein
MFTIELSVTNATFPSWEGSYLVGLLYKFFDSIAVAFCATITKNFG